MIAELKGSAKSFAAQPCVRQQVSADAAIRTLALAAGEMTESAFAAWLETNSQPPS